MKPIEIESLNDIHGGDGESPPPGSGAAPTYPPFPYQPSEFRPNYETPWTDTP